MQDLPAVLFEYICVVVERFWALPRGLLVAGVVRNDFIVLHNSWW